MFSSKVTKFSNLKRSLTQDPDNNLEEPNQLKKNCKHYVTFAFRYLKEPNFIIVTIAMQQIP